MGFISFIGKGTGIRLTFLRGMALVISKDVPKDTLPYKGSPSYQSILKHFLPSKILHSRAPP